jgi:hypothetical protein
MQCKEIDVFLNTTSKYPFIYKNTTVIPLVTSEKVADGTIPLEIKSEINSEIR